MLILKNGGSAVDAVEMAIKILEDREITNAGYGSNPNVDGVVECDAIVVDHMSRSGAVGAVARELHPSETFAQYLLITDLLQKLGILYLSHESCWIVPLSHCRYAEYLQICWSARGPQTLLINMASRSYHSLISCHQPQNHAGRNGVPSLCVLSAVSITDRHLRRRPKWNTIQSSPMKKQAAPKLVDRSTRSRCWRICIVQETLRRHFRLRLPTPEMIHLIILPRQGR